MPELIAWCGFFGAWLLVAGPIFQAAVELQEETFERDAFAEAVSSAPPQAPISQRWLFLPPVYYAKSTARRRRERDAVVGALTRDQREQLIGFMSKARGWLIVAGGAFLIAIKETWELHEVYEWPVAVFWVLVVVATIAAPAYTAWQMVRIDRALGTGKDAPG
jgi:hypothetical protein